MRYHHTHQLRLLFIDSCQYSVIDSLKHQLIFKFLLKSFKGEILYFPSFLSKCASVFYDNFFHINAMPPEKGYGPIMTMYELF